MQRLVVAALILVLAGSVLAIFVLGWRATLQERPELSAWKERHLLRWFAFVGMTALVLGASTGLLGGE